MKTFSLENSLSVSVNLYRTLLAAYPKKFREHYEKQMVQVFRDSLRDAYQYNGISGVIDLWLHTCVDLFVTALMERLMERSQHMFSPRIIFWGGVAGVFSGLFWMLTGLATQELYGGILYIIQSSEPLVFAMVLGMGGLAGLYFRQVGQDGRLGLAGFALGIIGTVLVLAAPLWGFASARFANLERGPTLSAPPMLILSLGLMILGVGIVLLGVASLSAKALYRWRGLPLGLGLLNVLSGMALWLVYYLPLSQGLNPWRQWSLIGGYVVYHVVNVWTVLGVVLGLGWIGLGIMLTAESRSQVVQPPPASA